MYTSKTTIETKIDLTENVTITVLKNFAAKIERATLEFHSIISPSSSSNFPIPSPLSHCLLTKEEGSL